MGDFELAEEAVRDAFLTALEVWPRRGVPSNPGTWIVTTARNRAIDRIRRARRLEDKVRELEVLVPQVHEDDEMPDSSIPDDRLRLKRAVELASQPAEREFLRGRFGVSLPPGRHRRTTGPAG